MTSAAKVARKREAQKRTKPRCLRASQPERGDEGVTNESAEHDDTGREARENETDDQGGDETVTALTEPPPAGEVEGAAAEASIAEDGNFIKDELIRLGLEEAPPSSDSKESSETEEMEDETKEDDAANETKPAEVAVQPPTQDGDTTAAATTTVRRISKSMSDHAPDEKHKLPRAGTDRRKVLEMMTGEFTPDEIAAVMKKDKPHFNARYVYQHAYCTYRDCGIGYRTVDEKLVAFYSSKEVPNNA